MLELQLVFYYMKWEVEMDRVYLGQIVNTHGIKGEIRILSDFEYKEKAFRVNSHIIIDNQTYLIKSYRKHKAYDMVTLDGFDNINQVLFLMKKKVYKEKQELNLTDTEILDEDLLEFKIVENSGKYGIIKEIFYASPTNKVLRVMFEKEVLIPMFSPMIKKINPSKKEIEVELMEGMM